MIISELERFLSEYPDMSLSPVTGDNIKICGLFSFIAKYDGELIDNKFDLEFVIDKRFPSIPPIIKETGGKIPNNGHYHINPDGSLCLGSPIQLKKILFENPDIVSFTEKCLVPFLLSVSIKLKTGRDFITGELAHGVKGLVDEYMSLFGLETRLQVISALRALGTKKRVANKRACPCECGQRLGKCHVHHKLNLFRPIGSRAWFGKQATDLSKGQRQ